MNHPTLDPALVLALAQALIEKGWQMATAESCTGGMIAAACTDLAGSSAWFERGVVTYSNASKTALLGVPAALIEQEGAVSQAVARAMAEGLLAQSGVELAVAVTGIAGPSGGSVAKPVGTVWMAWALKGQATVCECRCWPGDRASVRTLSVAYVLSKAADLVSMSPGLFQTDADPGKLNACQEPSCE